jgi:hypothetical protein
MRGCSFQTTLGSVCVERKERILYFTELVRLLICMVNKQNQYERIVEAFEVGISSVGWFLPTAEHNFKD